MKSHLAIERNEDRDFLCYRVYFRCASTLNLQRAVDRKSPLMEQGNECYPQFRGNRQPNRLDDGKIPCRKHH